MGLIVNILRNSDLGDCSNGGVSGQVNKLTLINVEGPFMPTEDAPAAMIVAGNLSGAKIIPCFDEARDMSNIIGPMMGGTYVTSSDSRFSSKLEEFGVYIEMVVPFHDRYETTDQYRALSI